jgi:hypothetical protein
MISSDSLFGNPNTGPMSSPTTSNSVISPWDTILHLKDNAGAALKNAAAGGGYLPHAPGVVGEKVGWGAGQATEAVEVGGGLVQADGHGEGLGRASQRIQYVAEAQVQLADRILRRLPAGAAVSGLSLNRLAFLPVLVPAVVVAVPRGLGLGVKGQSVPGPVVGEPDVAGDPGLRSITLGHLKEMAVPLLPRASYV